ncbi:MAG: metallophosphoesterase [Candidatus Nanoarchaeia archaeon]|nr:metallophosphoesterase [Candidatus Nanoarchaeia archaeon]
MIDLVFENIEYLKDSIYFSKERILIISDLHIGLGNNYNKLQYNITIEESKRLIKKIQDLNKKIDKIIILGDIKHSFSFDKGENFELHKFFETLSMIVKEIIIIKGNHDKMNEFKGVIFQDEYILKDNDKKYLLIHGDRKIENIKDYDLIIMGHEHPKINIFDKNSMRVESYKCFLRGENFIIIPNFNDFSSGNNVLDMNFLNKIFKKDEIYRSKIITSDPVLEIGVLSEIKDAM